MNFGGTKQTYPQTRRNGLETVSAFLFDKWIGYNLETILGGFLSV